LNIKKVDEKTTGGNGLFGQRESQTRKKKPQYLHETVNTTKRHANVKTILNPFFSTVFTQ